MIYHIKKTVFRKIFIIDEVEMLFSFVIETVREFCVLIVSADNFITRDFVTQSSRQNVQYEIIFRDGIRAGTHKKGF